VSTREICRVLISGGSGSTLICRGQLTPTIWRVPLSIRDDGWDALLDNVLPFCGEHAIPKLYMEQDQYIDRHKPRKRTNHANYISALQRYDCLNQVTDLQLTEFGDRFMR
jgi:hypothetical protein